MITKGIRGAIIVKENTSASIEAATLELLSKMVLKNRIKEENISHIIFTLTNDLNAEFPAKFVRTELKWTKTAMMCFHELDVPNALKMCLRVLIVVNCSESFEPEFIYMNGAEQLRT